VSWGGGLMPILRCDFLSLESLSSSHIMGWSSGSYYRQHRAKSPQGCLLCNTSDVAPCTFTPL
jgi:hypothetical protein